MRDLLGKNLTYKLVAIFLAVVLWMNASDQDTASFREKVVQVPLEVRSLSSSLVATDLPENVKVRVEGDWGAIDSLDASQFSAFVRLDSYSAGTHEAPVEVTVPPGVRLVEIIPSTVSVQLTEMASVQVPVHLDIEGEPATGFTALTPIIEPAEVIISGPEDVLKKIKYASVKVSLEGFKEGYVKVLPITPVGAGSDQFQVSVQPSTAKVTISIVQEEETKQVALEVLVEGTPLEGYTVGTVQVQPQQVEISGAPEVIKAITSIKTLPVDVKDRESSFTGKVGLNIPESVQVGQTEASVVVEIIKE